MSQLSYMEKLLDKVEVKRLTLGDIGEFIRGNGIQKKDLVEAGFPAVHYGQIFTRYGFSAVQSFTFISDELAKKSRIARKNDLLIATTSENDEDVLKSIAWLGEKVAISGDMMLFRHTQNVKYLAYYFQTEDFQKQKIKFITGAKVRRVSRDSLTKMTISIPSLEIQAEIVRILDAFTELTADLVAELTAELVARKQQYTYYREQLLTFEEDEAEWKVLDEVAVIGTGSHNTQDALEKGEYTFYARGRNPLRLDVFDFDETAIITAGDGAGVGKVFHYVEGKYALHQRAYRIAPNKNMEPRFIYHYIMTHFYGYIHKVSVSSSVTSLRRPMLLNFPIQIPSLVEQQRIVAILDKFNALTTSLTECLPREIELRQLQYEYYHELLLSFPNIKGDA